MSYERWQTLLHGTSAIKEYRKKALPAAVIRARAVRKTAKRRESRARAVREDPVRWAAKNERERLARAVRADPVKEKRRLRRQRLRDNTPAAKNKRRLREQATRKAKVGLFCPLKRPAAAC